MPEDLGEGLRALWQVFKLSDARLERHIGTDAFVLIRFLRLWKRLTFCMSLLSAVILIPIYAGPADGRGTRGKGGFNRFTMGNLKNGSSALWAPFVFTYVFTLAAMQLLEHEGKLYTLWRHRFLTQGDDDDGPQPRCSVVVEHVPPELRSDAALERYFRHLMGRKRVIQRGFKVGVLETPERKASML